MVYDLLRPYIGNQTILILVSVALSWLLVTAAFIVVIALTMWVRGLEL
jgi:hypothetical protein